MRDTRWFAVPDRMQLPLVASPTSGTLSGPARALVQALATETHRDPSDVIYLALAEQTRRHWSGPRCQLWEPFVAGTLAELAGYAPPFFSPPSLETAVALVQNAAARDSAEPLSEAERVAVSWLAQHGLHGIRAIFPDGYINQLLAVSEADTFSRKLDSAVDHLSDENAPLPWLALCCAILLPESGARRDALYFGLPPFNHLTKALTTEAARQGVTTWEDALRATRRFWETPGAGMMMAHFVHGYLDRMEQENRAMTPVVDAAAPPDPALLARLEARLAEAERAIAETTARADDLRLQASTAHREAAEARQARDRAQERIRVLERECEALRREAKVRATTPAETRVPVRLTVAGPAPGSITPAPATAPSEAAIREVFAGRRVYLFTGVDRNITRLAMAAAFERYGASCEVFLGNRRSQRGPDRFPTDALVIIETGHLGHSASEALAGRARASEAWYFMGRAGIGSLARRVAERWQRQAGGGVTRSA